MIDVRLTKDADPFELAVSVTEGKGETSHRVTLKRETYEKLGASAATPEAFVEAAFEFLLEREPKESIMSSFDVTVISRYFPEFESEIATYLDR
jgi:hypothetical protein